MILSHLSVPKGARKKIKRVGRGPGSGHGKTSGRGHKGQNARASGGVRLGFEGGQMPLSRRTPKRGFNSFTGRRFQEVMLDSLNQFPSGSEVTLETLKKKYLIQTLNKPVKILTRGVLKHPLTIKVNAISKNALLQVEKAGGKFEAIGKK